MHIEGKTKFLIKIAQYHGCWGPDSLRRHVIISRDTNNAGNTRPYLAYQI